MILCSLSCAEQSLMARDRGQELSLAGHSGWLCSGGRGDAGLSPKRWGLCCARWSPAVMLAVGKGKTRSIPWDRGGAVL